MTKNCNGVCYSIIITPTIQLIIVARSSFWRKKKVVGRSRRDQSYQSNPIQSIIIIIIYPQSQLAQ